MAEKSKALQWWEKSNGHQKIPETLTGLGKFKKDITWLSYLFKGHLGFKAETQNYDLKYIL